MQIPTFSKVAEGSSIKNSLQGRTFLAIVGHFWNNFAESLKVLGLFYQKLFRF